MNYPYPFPPPPLKQGDQIGREEFERRYEAMPELNKAELLDGEVHMPSPTRWDDHAVPDNRINWFLGHYSIFTPGVSAGGNGTIRLDMDNEPQPDTAMIILPAYGGQVQIGSDGYVEGAPELIGEVAASSVHIDLNKKLPIYRRNNVKEYVVWRVLDNEIDWFVLRNTEYGKLAVDDNGRYKSEAFPGLWLDPAALAAFDLPKVLAVLQEGLASPEHEEFVSRLANAGA